MFDAGRGELVGQVGLEAASPGPIAVAPKGNVIEAEDDNVPTRLVGVETVASDPQPVSAPSADPILLLIAPDDSGGELQQGGEIAAVAQRRTHHPRMPA